MTSPKLTIRPFPPIHWALASDHLTIFAGQEAEARARDYRDALKEGRPGTRIVDAKGGAVRTWGPSDQVSSLTNRAAKRPGSTT